MINQGLYEIRLREEFKNTRRLQQVPPMKQVLTIRYVDRISGNTISVLEDPVSALFPEHYKVRYSIPVYIARNQLKRNWSGEFDLSIGPEALMQPESGKVPDFKLIADNATPFNHHYSQGWVCTGGLWNVARDFGLWYFIIGCGSIFNQESAWMDDSGNGHTNIDAYNYWKNDRRKQKINNIDWPFDLRDRIEIGSPMEGQKNKIKIGIPFQHEVQKIKIIRNS